MVLSKISTKKELDTFKSELRKFSLDIYNFAEATLLDHLENDYSYTFSTLLKGALSLKDLDLNHIDKMQLDKHLKNLEEEIAKAKILELSLAFEPTEHFMLELKNWIASNMNEEVVLDLSIENELIAGPVIVYNGNFRDYSLRSKLKNYKPNV